MKLLPNSCTVARLPRHNKMERAVTASILFLLLCCHTLFCPVAGCGAVERGREAPYRTRVIILRDQGQIGGLPAPIPAPIPLLDSLISVCQLAGCAAKTQCQWQCAGCRTYRVRRGSSVWQSNSGLPGQLAPPAVLITEISQSAPPALQIYIHHSWHSLNSRQRILFEHGPFGAVML